MWRIGFPARGGPAAFDAAREQALLAETVIRAATELVGVDDAQTIVARQCEGLTRQVPNLVLAWTWFGAPGTPKLVPQIVAGAAADYGRRLQIDRNWLTARGPALQVLDHGRTAPFSVSALSPFAPWREIARSHGVRHVLALPLRSPDDGQRGLFVLYARVDRYFDRVGAGIFDALAGLFGAVLGRAGQLAALTAAAQRDPLTGLFNRHVLAMMESAGRGSAARRGAARGDPARYRSFQAGQRPARSRRRRPGPGPCRSSDATHAA